MKLLIISSILSLALRAYSTEKNLLVPATGTLMKYTSQDTNIKKTNIKPVSATGTMFIYSNN